MKIHQGIENLPKFRNPAVTTGTMDGVHLGHLKIIQCLREEAKKSEGEPIVFTLWPHPRLVLYPEDNQLRLLNTLDERLHLLSKAGVEHIIICPFTKKFSRLTSMQFIRDILLNKIGVRKLIVGYDHHFGRNRSGSYDDLKKLSTGLGFELIRVTQQTIKNTPVSSTKIRTAIEKGQIEKTNEMLGYDFFFTGKVIEGDKIGATIGFPTANIEIAESVKMIPADGVYMVKILHDDKTIYGMLNIGFRPTLNGQNRTIEVHLLDFAENIYGKTLTVSVSKMLRKEKKFEDLQKLKEQLMLDEKETREFFSRGNKETN